MVLDIGLPEVEVLRIPMPQFSRGNGGVVKELVSWGVRFAIRGTSDQKGPLALSSLEGGGELHRVPGAGGQGARIPLELDQGA